MTDRELMQQALEALCELEHDTFHPAKVFKHKPTIAALRQAIAEAEKQEESPQPDSACKEDDGCPTEKAVLQRFWRESQLKAEKQQPADEPVAWADEIIDDLHAQYNTDGIKEIDSGDALIRLDEAIAAVEEAEKRHTAPPQRKPLTEEEIEVLAKKHNGIYYDCDITFARAIEAAHGIKENK